MQDLKNNVDFPAFIRSASAVARSRFPVMVRGLHGIGKSHGIYDLATELAWDEVAQAVVYAKDRPDLAPYRVVERRASQMSEGDLLGLPTIDEARRSTDFNPPNWYKTACNEPVLLFLDEIDRAVSEVRQGFFELTDSRKISGFCLHPGTLIFAAINGGCGPDYQVADLDPAEHDRWTVFDLQPSVEDWVSWGRRINKETGEQNINEMILMFIQNAPRHLERAPEDAFEPGRKYPSRRSWSRLNEVLVREGLLQEDSDQLMVHTIVDAFVGFEAAVGFTDFVKHYEFALKPEDILNEGKWAKTKDWTVGQHATLADNFEHSGLLKEPLSKEQMVNFARYFVRAPSEVAMSLFTILTDGDEDTVVNFHKLRIKGPGGKSLAMKDHLIFLLGAGSKKTKKTKKTKEA